MFVLGRRASFEMAFVGLDNDCILSDKDNGKPLLFETEQAAREYFDSQSFSKSFADLNAFIREATPEELAA